MVAFLVTLLIAVVLNVLAYVLMPKPKQAKPEAAKDAENPTAEAGREMPVVFGTMIVKALNVLDFSEKNIRTYQVKA